MPKSRAGRKSSPAPGRKYRPRWSLVLQQHPHAYTCNQHIEGVGRLIQTGPVRIAPLWDQLVAARLGHQDRRGGGVLLDLLAQAVDVGFQRVGGHAGIVAPHLLQQHLARDRALAGAVEDSAGSRFPSRSGGPCCPWGSSAAWSWAGTCRARW